MSKKCKDNTEGVCQEWPKDDKLNKNMDKDLNALKDSLNDKAGMVYAYVLTTVKANSDGIFIQTGSAPNFQGDFITLCTCKHWMRTWKEPNDWEGVWIAGFTGINILGDRRNYLFYLMQVQKAFPSHKELWNWLKKTVREAKNASQHKCGDVYEPKSSLTDPFDPEHYCKPIEYPRHVHLDKDVWHNDIKYNKKTKRPPALLVGDPEHSYLWSKPKIYFKGNGNKRLRTKKWNTIGELISLLGNSEQDIR